MRPLMIDACGWVALVDGHLHLDEALRTTVGTCHMVILPEVRQELDRLRSERRHGLLLDLLDQRAETLPSTEEERHPDDVIVDWTHRTNGIVLTVDRALKRRILEAGGAVLEIRSDRRAHLVEL